MISIANFCYVSAHYMNPTSFTYFLNNFIVPRGFLPWENRVAFPGESQPRQDRATQPRVHAECFSVCMIHRTLTWTTGSLPFNVRRDVNACECTRGGGYEQFKRVHTESRLGYKFLAASGNRTSVSGVPVRRSVLWATSRPQRQRTPHAASRKK